MQKVKTPKKEQTKSEAKRKAHYSAPLVDPNKVKRITGHRTLGGLRK